MPSHKENAATHEVSRPLPPHPYVLSVALGQQPEIITKIWTDSPTSSVGTVVANKEIDTGVLHGPAGQQRRGRHSTALRPKDCENLLLAAEHANVIGTPFNRMLTIHFDAAGISNPVRATGHLLKLIGDWLRSYNTELTALWVRETGAAKGEHVHILMSVPPNIITLFNRRQRSWLKRIGAAWKRGVILSRPIGGSHKAAFSGACSCLYKQAISGALEYLLKGADTKARTKFGIHKCEPGGELWGKRCGTTENIGRTARARSLK